MLLFCQVLKGMVYSSSGKCMATLVDILVLELVFVYIDSGYGGGSWAGISGFYISYDLIKSYSHKCVWKSCRIPFKFGR